MRNLPGTEGISLRGSCRLCSSFIGTRSNLVVNYGDRFRLFSRSGPGDRARSSSFPLTNLSVSSFLPLKSSDISVNESQIAFSIPYSWLFSVHAFDLSISSLTVVFVCVRWLCVLIRDSPIRPFFTCCHSSLSNLCDLGYYWPDQRLQPHSNSLIRNENTTYGPLYPWMHKLAFLRSKNHFSGQLLMFDWWCASPDSPTTRNLMHGLQQLYPAWWEDVSLRVNRGRLRSKRIGHDNLQGYSSWSWNGWGV